VRLLERAEEVGHFTKWEGSQAVDASLLWLGMPYELIDLDDPRYAATVRRIEEELVSPGGGVHRYRGDTYYGGGEWILLTASLGSVYARRDHPGDRSRAERLQAWIEAQAGADGSLPEQVAAQALDPSRIEEWRRRWGESARPLAWSHAMYLLILGDLGHLEA
jgi:GH15 family glucan-1,4-alpha-glucosidase